MNNGNWKAAVIILLLLAGALAAGVSGYFYFTSGAKKQNAYSTALPVAAVLSRENEEFRLAEEARGRKDFQQALDHYTKALLEASDASQEAQIKFDIALMTGALGKYAEAIGLYKQIAANPAYYSLIRAYSVQEIGRMYHNYYGSEAAGVIKAVTFGDQPYASFLKGGDYPSAYTKLFDYAASIYPLALSESYVAYGRTFDLDRVGGATTTPEGRAYVEEISQALQKSQADVERMRQVPREVSDLPPVFSRQAIVVDYLARLGVPGYTSGQAEDLYVKAITQNAAQGGHSGSFYAYLYAVFLARHNPESRLGDLKKTLSAFFPGNSDNISPDVAVFFRSARTDPSLKFEKESTIHLGQLDPDFKTYLLSLGWHDSDFTSEKGK